MTVRDVTVVVTANLIVKIFNHPSLSLMMDHAALICLVLGLGSWGVMRKVMDSFGLEQELQRMVVQCAHGTIADCRVIEVLGDHGQCAQDHHTAPID